MNALLLISGDLFFLLFHTALTVFNLLGWAWHRTRRLNLITLLLTGASWFGLGLVYGIGYCPLTDWHWRILYRLGHYDLPRSYITYIIDRWTGLHVSAPVVEAVTVGAFFTALVLSVVLNIRDRQAGKKANENTGS
ncbi:MAG: DUF2784 family protein [Thermodesulfobacteriota bacterium]|nr:DUF2784 family protein [Thermodesulfobacteriota bacterium]